MGCVASKPSVSPQGSYHASPDNIVGRTRHQDRFYSSNTYSDWHDQHISPQGGAGTSSIRGNQQRGQFNDPYHGRYNLPADYMGSGETRSAGGNESFTYSSHQYFDWYSQNFMQAGGSEAPNSLANQEPAYSQDIDRSIQGSVISSHPSSSTDRVNYISALNDAVKLSKNRISFAKPNALVQFMNKKASENIGESSSGGYFGSLGFKSDFKNDEIFSDYTDNAWVVKKDLDFGEVINNNLFGPKVDGTTYYFDCSEYIQLLQLYALYNSINPAERQERFDGKEGFHIGSFSSTGIENKLLLTKDAPSKPFFSRASNEKISADESELFSQIPIGSRVTFTNMSSSADYTDFKNESAVKITKNKVAALGFHEEKRIYEVNELKYNLASMDDGLVGRVSAEQEYKHVPGSHKFNKAVREAISKSVFISEIAVFDTPLSKGFTLS